LYLLTVQANFAPELHPQDLGSSENPDCSDVAELAHYIVTKTKRTQQHQHPYQTSLRNKLRMKSRGKEIGVDPGLSFEFLDFLEACDNGDMALLKNVS
jgi:hypothetical protein